MFITLTDVDPLVPQLQNLNNSFKKTGKDMYYKVTIETNYFFKPTYHPL